jgi:hypothetical protein
LIAAGKSQEEMTRDLELYYSLLVDNCDNEIVDLREQLEIEKAGFREEAAEELYLKAHELDDLSNVFLECVHAHRKTLRHQLLTLAREPGKKAMRPNLFETYLRIVQTGAPEEIEKFS